MYTRQRLGFYFREDTTACVLSTMTGLDGGINFGGCPELFSAARWHTDVDRTPESKEITQSGYFKLSELN